LTEKHGDEKLLEVRNGEIHTVDNYGVCFLGALLCFRGSASVVMMNWSIGILDWGMMQSRY